MKRYAIMLVVLGNNLEYTVFATDSTAAVLKAREVLKNENPYARVIASVCDEI